MGGGKEDLIDSTQVLTVCARANSSRVWRAENICRHRPLGGAQSDPEPKSTATCGGRLSPLPCLARSCQGNSWHRMGGRAPNRSQAMGVGTAHPSSPRKTTKTTKTQARHHQPESTCGHEAAPPHNRPEDPLCLTTVGGQDIKKTLAMKVFPEHDSTFNK